MKALIDVANHGDGNKHRIPNLRYIGVGPAPSQSSRMCRQSKHCSPSTLNRGLLASVAKAS